MLVQPDQIGLRITLPTITPRIRQSPLTLPHFDSLGSLASVTDQAQFLVYHYIWQKQRRKLR